MKFKILSLLIIAIMVSLVACQGKKEPGKKEIKKKGLAGYVLNFKPNDSLDLVPPKTIILQHSSADEQNNFCLDVIAKAIDHVSGIFFALTFDPAYVNYQSFNPGTLFEQKGKPVYKIALEGGQKGKLGVKISFESGSAGASGSGKLVTLRFKALEQGRSDILFENGEMLDLQKKKVAGVQWIGGLLWALEA